MTVLTRNRRHTWQTMPPETSYWCNLPKMHSLLLWQTQNVTLLSQRCQSIVATQPHDGGGNTTVPTSRKLRHKSGYLTNRSTAVWLPGSPDRENATSIATCQIMNCSQKTFLQDLIYGLGARGTGSGPLFKAWCLYSGISFTSWSAFVWTIQWIWIVNWKGPMEGI